jgi:ASC-1-like (ASCH) protein
MNVWEFGLVTEPFEAVAAGRKTIEGRLNKGKFAQFAAGDIVKIRRDYRDELGVIQDGEPDAARVKVVAVREYPDFASLVKAEGYERVASRPVSVEETIASYGQHYSIEEQNQFGVLAIEIIVV